MGLDSSQKISDHNAMGPTGNASQTTILRKGQMRVREMVLTGTLDSGATTTVHVEGVLNPTVVSFLGMAVGGTAGNWLGQDHAVGATAANSFTLTWNDKDHGSVPNAFVFSGVGSNVVSSKYRIWFRYVEGVID